MTEWIKLTNSGSVVVGADEVLEVFTQSAGSAYPDSTEVPTATYRGAGNQALYTASGSDVYFRLQNAGSADAMAGADPDLDTFAEVLERFETNEAEIATRVPDTREVTGGGLATGGGALDADLVITVPKSTQEEAEAGTDDATAMTPVRTFDAIAAWFAALPTADPEVAGEVWNNAGVVTVSAGA